MCSKDSDYNAEFLTFYLSIANCLHEILGVANIVIHVKLIEKQQVINLLHSLKGINLLPKFLTFCGHPEETYHKMQVSSKELSNYYFNIVNSIRHILDEIEMKSIPMYMIKWNTLVGRDFAATTFFRSALILDATLSIFEEIEGIGFPLNT